MNDKTIVLSPIKKEDIKLDDSKQIVIYNPLTKLYKIEVTDKKCIVFNKHASPLLRYFCIEENDS